MTGARPLRVAWVSHSGDLAGGAQLVLLEGVRALADAGISSHVVVPTGGELADALAGDGVPVSVAPVPEWVRWWELSRARIAGRSVLSAGRLLRAAGPVRRILRAAAPDVVVTNTLAAGVAAVAARTLGLPHVWYVHEFGGADFGMHFDFGEAPTLRLVGRLSRVVLANSEAVAAKLAGHGLAGKVRVVYCAVDVPEVEPVPVPVGGGLRLVIVGRLSRIKGQDEAIRAVAAAVERGADVSLVVVGGDPSSSIGRELQQLARTSGIADRVTFTGQVPDPHAFVLGADAALMCSPSEAFGRVTVEAMKLGRPVLGTRSGGTAELVRDGWNGYLYRPGDIGGLADRIVELAGDPATLARLAGNARDWSLATFSRQAYGEALAAALGAATDGVRP